MFTLQLYTDDQLHTERKYKDPAWPKLVKPKGAHLHRQYKFFIGSRPKYIVHTGVQSRMNTAKKPGSKPKRKKVIVKNIHTYQDRKGVTMIGRLTGLGRNTAYRVLKQEKVLQAGKRHVA